MAMKPRYSATTVSSAPASQRGFTLVEIMIAMLVMVTALVTLAAVFAYGFSTVQTAQEDILAKAEAREMLEAVYAARNSGQITFDQIDNTPTTANGIFLVGMRPANQSGDGLFNTANDTSTPEELILPGPDGVLNTSDDVKMPFSFMQRQIQITPVQTNGAVNPNLKQIAITIQYQTATFGTRTYQISSLISSYR